MRHIVHDGRLDALLADEFHQLRHRLLVEHHRLAEDHEFRSVFCQQHLGRLGIDAVRVVRADREIHDHLLFGDGIGRNVIVERAHGLRRQVSAAHDVVVHDPAQPLRRALAIHTVLEVHERREYGGVGHLAGGHAGLDLRAAEVFLHLLDKHRLDLRDEIRALIIEDLRIIERLLLLMLGVAVGGVGCAQQAHRARLRVFRRDQVDAALLPPQVVFLRLFQKLRRLLRIRLRRGLERLRHNAGQDGTGVGSRVLTDVVADDERGLALAADIHFNVEILADAGIHIRKADGALAGLLGDDGIQSLALRLEIRDHGAGGHIADGLSLRPCVLAVDREALSQDALPLQIDRLDAVRQIGQRGVITVHNLLEGLKLLFERSLSDELALFRREGDRKFCQRNGVDGNFAAKLAFAHFVAVERKRRLHAERVARAQRRGLCAQLDQPVPEIARILGIAVQLVADRLAGIAGLGQTHRTALHFECIERVFHILHRQRSAAGERHEDLLGLRTLYGDGRIAVGDVCQLHVEGLRLPVQVRKILVDVAGIDDEEIFSFFKAVEIGVVDGIAVFIRDDAVLRLIHVERKHVARKNMLQKGDLLRALDVDTAHVGNVEDTAVAAAVEMLGHDAVRVLNGHIPAAEIDHRRSGVQMGLIQYRSLEFAHTFPPFFIPSRRLCACGQAVLR